MLSAHTFQHRPLKPVDRGVLKRCLYTSLCLSKAPVLYYMYKWHSCFSIDDHKTASNSLSGVVSLLKHTVPSEYCTDHAVKYVHVCMHAKQSALLQELRATVTACTHNVNLHVSCHIRASTLQRPPRVTMLRCFGQLNTQMV